ncbi:MAG: T9SS type A sorting domain-containing protein [Chitinophagales bacterium]|nr:T9SS type A sorting domain-containing protein [Chitinophagales bacterium]
MKKFLLLIGACGIMWSGFSQAPLNAPLQPAMKTPDRIPAGLHPVNLNELKKENGGAGTRDLAQYWVNYSDAVDLEFNDGAGENGAFTALWPDSSVVVTDGAGGNFHWWIQGYSHIFDPVSEYIGKFVDEYYSVIGGAEDLFNEEHGFEIDSATFYYAYLRYNTSYTDTLFVYKMGPTSTAVTNDWAYYFDVNSSGLPEEGEDILIYGMVYNPAKNSPLGSYTTDTILLSDADSSSFAIPITIDVDFNINDNSDDHYVGLAFQFKPGQPYSFGDTLIEQSDPPIILQNPLNTFYLFTYEELFEGDPESWIEGSVNQDAIVTPEIRYQLYVSPYDFLNDYYYSTFGFVPEFAYEHAYVDWLVAPKGVNFLAIEPSPCVDLQMEFNDISNFVINEDDAEYFWEFDDDGAVALEKNPVFTFSAPGTYEVKHVVTEGSVSYEQTKSVSVDFCVGINEIQELATFKLYPNPASEAVTVELTFSSPASTVVSILSLNGEKVYTTSADNITTYSNTIDVNNLASGVYVMEIVSDRRISTKTFVVE